MRTAPALRVEVYRYADGENPLAWSGLPDDDTAPLAFVDEIRDALAALIPGDTFALSKWYYGKVVNA